MSLILAIEPDRRQVAHLISIVRHVAGAELVLADTTERALESIGNGVPDLILVPALLSPQDDAALAAALRVIATAAHVQMLTIPTFATAKPRQKSRGMLSAFRRKSDKEAPLDGCDPNVFAEEITSYLQRASEARAAAQLLEDDAEAGSADAFAAPAQTFDNVPAGFESAGAPAFDESPAEESTAASRMATAPATEDAAPVGLVGTVAAVETAAIAETAEAAAIVEAAGAEVETFAAAPVIDELPAALGQIDVPVIGDVHGEPFPEISIAAAPQPALALDEIVGTLEQTEPLIDEADADPLAELLVTATRAEPAMALDEFVATLERTELPTAVDAPAEPSIAAAATDTDCENESIDIDLTTGLEEAVPEFAIDAASGELPDLDELLADFERADLPVFEEVRAEQWIEASDEPEEDKEEATQADIDLSIELQAVLHSDEPAEAVEPAASLKPFDPVVPVERFEPFPLAAWQSWPRLEGGVSTGSQDSVSDESDDADKNQIAEFEAALFEAAVQEEESLARFEPVVPVESLEPLPLSAWRCWPRLEGVTAEAYQEPIAPRKSVARPEWVELMRSLREDIARRRSELAQPVQAVPAPQKPQRPRAEVPVQAAAAKPAPVVEPAKKRPKRTRPIEDEWGLFDPEQCGFAALLDKLDEITVTPPSSNTRRQA